MTTTAKITYRKSDIDKGRYDVDLNGRKVGWVRKDWEGRWTFIAAIYQWGIGKPLARDFDTRRDAVLEGFGNLRIRHLGRIATLNPVTFREEWRYFSDEELRAAEEMLLDEKYPMAKEATV